jgi:hypothetical protein
MRFLLPALCVLCASCVPTLPSHFAEGTEILEPKSVGITAAGGLAAAGGDCCREGYMGGGGELRMRVGIGARSEIGGSFLGASHGKYDPQASIPYLVGGKISYKIAPVRWLALVGGAGAAAYASTPMFGGDLAVIVAPYIAANGTQIYTGARGAFAIPKYDSQSHGLSESITIPLGVSIHTSDKVRVLLEAGFFGGGGQLWDEAKNTRYDTEAVGAYGVVGAHFTL